MQRVFLVKDDEPFASAKVLDDVGRGLFWDPVRRYFVLQKQPTRDRGVPSRVPLDRYAIGCSGATVEIDPNMLRRLQPIRDENATYVMSAKGDLIVGSQVEESFAHEITVFYGDKTSRISAPASYADCPDVACEPLYEFIGPGP